jgi:hypothetical protein
MAADEATGARHDDEIILRHARFLTIAANSRMARSAR